MALWGKTDTTADAPKYLSSADADKAVFIDTTEAAANKDIGLGTGGWNLYSTYTDANGATRHKAECLVAMGVSNADAGDNDTVAPAPVITIGTQPQSVTVAANSEDAVFTIATSVTQGATATYQWQWVASAFAGDDPLVWNDVTFGTGATTDTFNAGQFGAGDDGALFRCVVSVAGGADVTSDAATLSVTP